MNKIKLTSKIKIILKHLKTINKHRWEVFKAMRKCGYPIRGMFHDLSKYSPVEFLESIKYYQGSRSPIEACKEDKGYSDAWFHHRGRNKHHSQYWVDISFGEIVPCEIPWEYLVEFICDGIAAGKVYQGKSWNQHSPLKYWKSRDCKSFFHDNTYKKIEEYYRLIDKHGWDKVASFIKKYGDFVLCNNHKAMCELDADYREIYEDIARDIQSAVDRLDLAMISKAANAPGSVSLAVKIPISKGVNVSLEKTNEF